MILKKIIDSLSLRTKKQKIYIKVYKTYTISNFIRQFLNILSTEGFLHGYYLSNIENNSYLVLLPQYNINGVSSISSIQNLLKRNNILYINIKNILLLKKKEYSTYILSTSKGLMTLESAILNKIGGILICKIN